MDPTPFFSDFKDVKKLIFFLHIFFLITYPQAHLFSLKNFVIEFYLASITVFQFP
jgi:hypothetical protein